MNIHHHGISDKEEFWNIYQMSKLRWIIDDIIIIWPDSDMTLIFNAYKDLTLIMRMSKFKFSTMKETEVTIKG